MIDPSGIKLPEGEDFIIDEVKTGEYVVQNAYDGNYEYFPGRPMKIRIETSRSRGFGFVEMSSQEKGEKAIPELNGQEVCGREITVNEAKPREDRGGGGGYGGGRNRW